MFFCLGHHRYSEKREPISLDFFEELPFGTCSGAALEGTKGTTSPRKPVLPSKWTLQIGLTVTITNMLLVMRINFEPVVGKSSN